MTDIVERLRKAYDQKLADAEAEIKHLADQCQTLLRENERLARESADEIERFRNALKFYAESTEGGNIARAVLAGIELDQSVNK